MHLYNLNFSCFLAMNKECHCSYSGNSNFFEGWGMDDSWPCDILMLHILLLYEPQLALICNQLRICEFYIFLPCLHKWISSRSSVCLFFRNLLKHVFVCKDVWTWCSVMDWRPIQSVFLNRSLCCWDRLWTLHEPESTPDYWKLINEWVQAVL